jgi:hypothetical protein
VTTEQELVRAVLAEPDADGPRRAFAAWAKAQPYPKGDPPRAELIDVQLARADAMRSNQFIATWMPFYKRARELLAKSGYRWREPLERFEDRGIIARSNPERFAYDFRRGFVEHVEMTAHAFAVHAGALFGVAPIRFVTMLDVGSHPDVLASPYLSQIAGLVMVDQGVDDSAIEALASSPHSRRLRWLAITHNKITMHGLEAMCASPNLRGLLYCKCSNNGFPDPMDRFGHEGEAIISNERTQLGIELEARFGVQPWFHAPWFFNVGYPPDFEAAADAEPASATDYASV